MTGAAEGGGCEPKGERLSLFLGDWIAQRSHQGLALVEVRVDEALQLGLRCAFPLAFDGRWIGKRFYAVSGWGGSGRGIELRMCPPPLASLKRTRLLGLLLLVQPLLPQPLLGPHRLERGPVPLVVGQRLLLEVDHVRAHLVQEGAVVADNDQGAVAPAGEARLRAGGGGGVREGADSGDAGRRGDALFSFALSPYTFRALARAPRARGRLPGRGGSSARPGGGSPAPAAE